MNLKIPKIPGKKLTFSKIPSNYLNSIKFLKNSLKSLKTTSNSLKFPKIPLTSWDAHPRSPNRAPVNPPIGASSARPICTYKSWEDTIWYNMFYDYHSFRLSVLLGLQYPASLEVPVPSFSLLKPTGYPKDPVGMWRNGATPQAPTKRANQVEVPSNCSKTIHLLKHHAES